MPTNRVVHATSPTVTLPPVLPAVHVSTVKWLSAIANQGRLVATECKVFAREQLYLFYGGAYYSPSRLPSDELNQLPVAFMLNPSVFEHVSLFYPFDTGAVASGRCGPAWSTKLMPFKATYGVNARRRVETPSKLVFNLFGDNLKYQKGDVSPTAEAAALPHLVEYLGTDLTSLGVDQRQRRIECIVRGDLDLRDYIEWVGVPDTYEPLLVPLWKAVSPRRIQIDTYDSSRGRSPAEWGTVLDHLAQKVVKDWGRFS